MAHGIPGGKTIRDSHDGASLLFVKSRWLHFYARYMKWNEGRRGHFRAQLKFQHTRSQRDLCLICSQWFGYRSGLEPSLAEAGGEDGEAGLVHGNRTLTFFEPK